MLAGKSESIIMGRKVHIDNRLILIQMASRILHLLNKWWKRAWVVAAFNQYYLDKTRENIAGEKYRLHLQSVTRDTLVKALNAGRNVHVFKHEYFSGRW